LSFFRSARDATPARFADHSFLLRGRPMRIPKLLASGSLVDLADLDPAKINIWTDIAQPLSRLARFDGQTPNGLYSVAQHCVIGADALIAEGHSERVALAFLIHDAHEAFLGDITTPTVQMLDWVGGFFDGGGRGFSPSTLIRLAKAQIDQHIERLAGFFEPRGGYDLFARIDEATRNLVHEMDVRMLSTERLTFCWQDGDSTQGWPESVINAKPVELIASEAYCWSRGGAAEEWMKRWIAWHPATSSVAFAWRLTDNPPVARTASPGNLISDDAEAAP
jgi:hypothetical protein